MTDILEDIAEMKSMLSDMESKFDKVIDISERDVLKCKRECDNIHESFNNILEILD